MVVSHDDNAAIEVQQLLTDDVPVVMVNGRQVPVSSIQLVNGVFVDEAGRQAGDVKSQTWYQRTIPTNGTTAGWG